MDFMKLVNVCELNHVNSDQMVLVLGWIEEYLPHNKTLLHSCEKGNKSVVQLDLSSCDITELTQHGLFRIIGRYYNPSGGGLIKVHSLHATPTWNYHNFSQLVHEQRSFTINHCEHT